MTDGSHWREGPPPTGEIFHDEEYNGLRAKINFYIENREQFSEEDYERIQEAISEIIGIYKDERRLDGSFSLNHKLRAGLHVIELFGIQDVDVICAAFLHDIVEDTSGRARQASYQARLHQIRLRYGERVAYLVGEVTTDHTKHLPEEEANGYYLEHFTDAIKDPFVFYVKLADFIDNGTNFYDIPNAEKRKRQAGKYLPIYQICIDRLDDSDVTLIPDENKAILIMGLEEHQERARKIFEGVEDDE